MARIEGLKRPGLLGRFVYWFARRRFGRVPEPLTIVAHHPWLRRGNVLFELAMGRSKLVDARLKALASLKTASLIGCPF